MFGFRLRGPAMGDDITADWARELVKAVRSLRLVAGPGIKLTRTPDGTTVSAAGADGRPAAPVGLAEVDVGTVVSSNSAAGAMGTYSCTGETTGKSYELDILEVAFTDTLLPGSRVIIHPVVTREVLGN